MVPEGEEVPELPIISEMIENLESELSSVCDIVQKYREQVPEDTQTLIDEENRDLSMSPLLNVCGVSFQSTSVVQTILYHRQAPQNMAPKQKRK